MKRCAILVLASLLLLFGCGRSPDQEKATPVVTKKVRVNEAARTLLYLPLYHAERRGFFKARSLDVEIVTGGTATVSFAAMLSGEAEFSQADPMYVAIAREKNGPVKVVSQIVARVAVWGTTRDHRVTATADQVRGKRIATHQRPMTAYTYTERWLQELGLDSTRDVQFVAGKPGTELAAFLAGQADIMMSVEPATSQAVEQGARVFHSFPQALGDRVFSALMTREDVLARDRPMVTAVVAAFQEALDDMRRNPAEARVTAQKYFANLDAKTLDLAIARLLADEVWPQSVKISRDSWDRAVAVRVAAGDLKQPARFEDCVVTFP